MNKILLSLVLSLELPSSLCVSTVLPHSDTYGDYRSSSSRMWPTWQVVDTDTHGLNCRVSQEFQQAWSEHYLYEGTPRLNIVEWPVVKKFKYNVVLLADLTPAGNAIILDERNKPWLKVKIDKDNDKICFVRANSKYIKPILTSLN